MTMGSYQLSLIDANFVTKLMAAKNHKCLLSGVCAPSKLVDAS